jgi:hypothetical protein
MWVIASSLCYMFQPLVIRLTQCLIFKGVPLPDTKPCEARVAMYADDTTVLAADTNSVNIAISYFNLFCSASGAALNRSKCEACVVYGVVDSDKWPKWLKIVKSLKICGVFFGEEAQSLNEENLQINIEKTLNKLQDRNLTYFCKAIIVNVLVLPRLWYIATVCTFTNAFFKWLERDISSRLSRRMSIE